MARYDFDYLHRFYDPFMKFFRQYRPNLIQKQLNLTGDEIIADIGGGTGFLAEKIAPLCSRIYVIDESRKMLAHIKSINKIIPYCLDACKTGLKNNSVDVVILSDTMHHIANHNCLFNEIHRILKPEGKMLINDLNLAHHATKLVYYIERFVFGSKINYKTIKELILILISKGFRINHLIDKKYWFILTVNKI